MPLAQCGSGTGNAIQLCCHCRDPQGRKNKYELDKKRVCCGWTASSTPHALPANYGMIPLTYADDHDPLDVLILCQEPLVPMCMVTCRPSA